MFTFKPIQNKMGANIATLPIFSRALQIYQNTHAATQVADTAYHILFL
jgi:hypothetical protein